VRLNNGPDAPSDVLVARETQRFALERLAGLPEAPVAVARPSSSPGGIIEID
jgi:hypothetical protein